MKSEQTVVARPYAKAAFQCALQGENTLAAWQVFLTLAAAAAEDKVLKPLIIDPRITKQQRLDVFARDNEEALIKANPINRDQITVEFEKRWHVERVTRSEEE